MYARPQKCTTTTRMYECTILNEDVKIYEYIIQHLTNIIRQNSLIIIIIAKIDR